MGISCDFEARSMESEIKPTSKKEFLKLNGNHGLEATPAISTAIDVITIDDPKSTDVVIDLASPTPQETETIVIVDDAEPEEGEIIASDNEFEAISSDEEFSLRQQIEALEAKNRELEKIASISTRPIDYGYRRSPNYTNYKATKNHMKPNPPLSSVINYKTVSLSHVENISSDEAQIVDSENEFPALFDSKKYGRSHRTSKKEKRQSRRKARITENEKERCSAHGKRRCIDANCHPIEVTVTRKKRARHKYDDRKGTRSIYSSDSEHELLRNREELKMALNIIEPSNRPVNSSTLSHKLSAIQKQQALDDGKKTATKHRKRKNSRSPDRGRPRSKSPESKSKRARNENGRSKTRTKAATPIVVHDDNDNDIQEEEDEVMSLEEQELRLIALKSAVLKKHEARKRRQLAMIQSLESVVVSRPYSPTDSVVMVAEETGEKSNDCIDSDNNNMDISPISSPGNQYQPMDMELASSNENSKSPIFSYEKPQTFSPYEQFIDWGAVAIPVPINPTFVDMHQFSMMCPIPPVMQATELKEHDPSISMDNEEELRAQLIKQMRNTSGTNSVAELPIKFEKNVPKDSSSHVDDSLEEDCLRSLLLSSKGKKPNISIEPTNGSNVPVLPSTTSNKLPEPSDQAKCDDMPKLALNLREALKRLKNNQQNKVSAAEQKKENDKCGEPLQVCDQNEIQKTVVSNRVDKNENELCHTITASMPIVVTTTLTEATTLAKKEDEGEMVEQIVPVAVQRKATAPTPNQSAIKDQVEELPKLIKAEITTEATPIVPSKPIKLETTKPIVKQSIIKPNAIATQKPIAVVKIKPKLAPKPKTVVPAKKPHSTTPPIVKPILATTATTSTNINQLESIRKTTGSPVISTWTAKPVKKLIITLNANSSSDDDDMDDDSKPTQTTNEKNDTDSGGKTNDTNKDHTQAKPKLRHNEIAVT